MASYSGVIVISKSLVLQLLIVSNYAALGQSRLLCNEDMATACINSTVERHKKDVILVEEGKVDLSVQDLYCSMVFSLKRSRMECVDKSIHGCENDIKHTVESYYEETLDYFEGLCAREVKAPENQSGNRMASPFTKAATISLGAFVVWLKA